MTVAEENATVAAMRVGGRYAILGLLGTGGMGSVYRAHDDELDEVVALKFLRPELVAAPEMLDRFRSEVKLARRVTHRNVARMFDIGEHQGQRFLTMELIEGEGLSRVLAREGALAPDRAIEIGLALCDGLAAAHAAGVIHRDLKPDNVLLERTGRVVITDFGIARAPFDGPSGLTRGAVGTPAYMAPEQVEGAADLDGRADLYALGCVLFEMLTGQALWIGDSPIMIAVARMTQDPLDPRDLNPRVSAPLAEVVLRCVRRRREDRFARAEDVAAALSSARGARVPTAPPPAAPTPVRAMRVAPALEPGDRTVAVLPFRNQGPAEDEYLAEALTDDLIDALSVTRGLRVRPRRLVSARATDPDLPALGRALDVQVVVEGTLRRAGDAVRISARVISVAEGLQLWAGRFDRPARDLLAINDEVAQAVARALTGGRDAPVRQAPSDPVAVDLYLRARRALQRAWSGLGDLDAAIELFEEGLARAPDDPGLLSGYATALARHLITPRNMPPDLPARAREAAERAVAAAPHLGEPWLALAVLQHMTGDWPAAARSVRTALARAPGLIEAHKLLATMQLEVGQPDEALFRLESIRSLEPDLGELRSDLARGYALLGRWDRAEAIIESRLGDLGSALSRDLVRVRLALWRRAPTEPLDWPADGPAATVVGRTMEAALQTGQPPEAGMQMLDAAIAQLPDASRLRPLILQLATELRAFTGDRERTLAQLQRAADALLYDVLWLDRCPLLAFVRDTPEFAAQRARVEARARTVRDALADPLA
jgi:serine/threonine-protein kinase